MAGFLYRAVDKARLTVDFYLSGHSDVGAATRFSRQAMVKRGPLDKITLDGYAASHRAIAELKEEQCLPTQTAVRSSAYLNNLIEQDRRPVKARVGPMLGFKNFGNVTVVITDIELAHMIRKGQFKLTQLLKWDSRDLWMEAYAA